LRSGWMRPLLRIPAFAALVHPCTSTSLDSSDCREQSGTRQRPKGRGQDARESILLPSAPFQKFPLEAKHLPAAAPFINKFVSATEMMRPLLRIPAFAALVHPCTSTS